MDRRVLQDLFSNAVRSDFAWRRNAAQLLESASLILQHALGAKGIFAQLKQKTDPTLTADEEAMFTRYNQHEVGFFLVALAVENLLKGLWVFQNQERIGTVDHIKKDLGEHFGHDQVRIAGECGLSLTEAEQELLIGFREMAEWRGKYPVPLRFEHYRAGFASGPLSRRLFELATSDDPLSPGVTAFIQRLVDATIPKTG